MATSRELPRRGPRPELGQPADESRLDTRTIRQGGSRLWHIRQSILSGRPITEFYHYSHQSRRLLGQCERLCIHLSFGSQYLADQSFLEQECYPGLAGGWIGVYTPLRNLVCGR